MGDEPTLDVRGLLCPWPVLRLAKLLRDSQTVMVRIDDATVLDEIVAAGRTQGWYMIEDSPGFLRVRRVGR